MRPRLKIQTIRSLLWLGAIAAFLAVAFLLVKMYLGQKRIWAPLPNSDIEAAQNTPGSLAQDGSDSSAREFDRYAVMWKLNVTGKEEAKPVEAVDTGPAKVALRPLSEVVKLVSTAYSDDSMERWALVEYLEANAATAGARVPPQPPQAADPSTRWKSEVSKSWLKQGDSLEPPYDAAPYEATVVQITSDQVLFRWGAEEVALETPKLPHPEPTVRTLPPALGDAGAEAAPAVDPETLRASRPLGEDPDGPDGPAQPDAAEGWFIGTDEQARIKTGYRKILDDVEIDAVFNERIDKPQIRIVKVPEDSLVAERGFEEGDLILAINGRVITSKESVVTYLRDYPDLSTYRVEIERKGKVVTRTFKTR